LVGEGVTAIASVTNASRIVAMRLNPNMVQDVGVRAGSVGVAGSSNGRTTGAVGASA
jgi:hypothetical protein